MTFKILEWSYVAVVFLCKRSDGPDPMFANVLNWKQWRSMVHLAGRLHMRRLNHL